MLLSNDLELWITNKKQLIKSQRYLVSFEYSVKEKKSLLSKNKYNKLELYSIVKDTSIMKLDNRITFCNSNYWETIDLSSKQIFLQDTDTKIEDIKKNILSIFLEDSYKIVKLRNNKYLLSMDDYFINMYIKYEDESDKISQIDINDSSKKISIKNFNLLPFSSIPYNKSEWKDFQKFDIRSGN